MRAERAKSFLATPFKSLEKPLLWKFHLLTEKKERDIERLLGQIFAIRVSKSRRNALLRAPKEQA